MWDWQPGVLYFFLLNQSIDNHIYIYIISIYIYILYIYIHVHRWFTLIHTNRTSMQYTKSPCYRIKYYVSFFCFTKCRCTIHVWSGRSMNSISHSKPLASVFSTDIYLFVCLSINVSLSTSIYFYLLLSTSIYFYLLLSTIYPYLSVSICI